MTSSIINALAFPSPERAEWRLASLRRRQNLMWFTTSTGEKIPAELLANFRSQVELVEAEMLATGSVRFAAMELLPSERGVN